jgi:hypothetical protein
MYAEPSTIKRVLAFDIVLYPSRFYVAPTVARDTLARSGS